MRGEHRDDQRMGEQALDRCTVDAFALQRRDGGGDVGALFGGNALAILGQVGEHREQHETADEIERLVEAEVLEMLVDRVAAAGAAMALDGGAADRLRRLEQGIATIGADDVAELRAEEADVGIVGDGGERSGVDGSHARYAALR
jgi:hypothetical protein